MEIVLGTAQFGLDYGIAGRGQVPELEVRRILGLAHEYGIRWIDTAPVYGEAQARLVALAPAQDAFLFVSKIPGLVGSVRDAIASLERSRMELGAGLAAILFHRSEDLTRADGLRVWDAAREWCHRAGIALGSSTYDPDAAQELFAQCQPDLLQIPGNAFDQRLVRVSPPANVAIHVRSIFLQGLLLMERDEVLSRARWAIGHWQRWHDWCQQRGQAKLDAAIAIAKSLPHMTHAVFGVHTASQLAAILASWDRTSAQPARELESCDKSLIDPRNWP